MPDGEDYVLGGVKLWTTNGVVAYLLVMMALVPAGKPIGRYEALGPKVAFIAATTFALEAVVDLSSHMADEDRTDIRIEAPLAKPYGSEMGWLMADERGQLRGQH